MRKRNKIVRCRARPRGTFCESGVERGTLRTVRSKMAYGMSMGELGSLTRQVQLQRSRQIVSIQDLMVCVCENERLEMVLEREVPVE